MAYFDRDALIKYLANNVRLNLQFGHGWSYGMTPPTVDIWAGNEWRRCSTAAEVAQAFADGALFKAVKIGNILQRPTAEMLAAAALEAIPFPQSLAARLVIDGLIAASAQRAAGREDTAMKIAGGSLVAALVILAIVGENGSAAA